MFYYAFEFIQSFILYSGYITGFVFVIYKIRSGEATIGDLVAFTGLWSLLLGPVDYFSSIVGELLEEFLDTTRLRRIIERDSRVEEGDKALEYIEGKVEFRNVSFSYPGSKGQNIDGMSITIKGGSKVAFVGPSGVGKTTIFKLLMWLFVLTEGGAILIDG
jgi:ATP-binding cassette, subfamily C, bacterial LapB